MNYPKYIYRKYEIAEKEIYGEKHYGLVRIYDFILFKFKKLQWVASFSNYSGHISDGDLFGRKWHRSKLILKSAIEKDNQEQEWKFEKKVTS